jgi:hypothetical protein
MADFWIEGFEELEGVGSYIPAMLRKILKSVNPQILALGLAVLWVSKFAFLPLKSCLTRFAAAQREATNSALTDRKHCRPIVSCKLVVSRGARVRT